jgi:hypothetical protein
MNFPPTSVATVILAIITTIVLFVWSKIDPKSRPYSWMAGAWTLLVFIVFSALLFLSLDEYQAPDILFMSNAVPGVILGSLIALLVIAGNEIYQHTRKHV